MAVPPQPVCVALQRSDVSRCSILESLPATVMRVSLDGTIEFVNRDLPSEYPVGQSIYAQAPADQHDVMRSALERTRTQAQPTSWESFVLTPDGKRDWRVTTVGPILRGDQVVGFTLVTVGDSRIFKAEDALVESRARLKLALDAGNVGVWRWDKLRDLVEWDDKLSAMWGVTPERAPRNVAEFMALVPEAHRGSMGAHIGRALETGVYPDYELETETPTGTRVFIIKGGMLRGAAGEIVGLLGGVVDVTEQRHMHEHLREAQKLEAVGQLSAGVAHNFNNMLAVIVPALELAKLGSSGVDAQLLDDALTSATNAAQLVRQLMVFSRSHPHLGTQHEALADVARRAVELCRQTFERRVTLQLGDLDAARFASVEAGPMEQALMNLLLNARDAVMLEPSRPARIEVSARRVDAPEAERRQTEARGPYVELRVQDTGCGMDATTRRRMLEPFFTTKATGRGTGLGLATAWATVKAHYGFLECESELGEGTVFSLLLPAGESEVAQVAPSPPAGVASGAGRVVLLIDDEEAVSRANAAVLRAAGFKVLLASSGELALRLASGHTIDAVVLDYSMPGLSAQDTLAGLRRGRPGLPVVCLSGLGTTLEGATSQLIKPASRGELVRAIEEALRAR